MNKATTKPKRARNGVGSGEFVRLSSAQTYVMEWLYGGWIAYGAHGATIEINGRKVCNIDTISTLVRHGLIEEVGPRQWQAKRCPVCNRRKKLTGAGCCDDCYL